MNFWLPNRHAHETPRSRWPGAAFLVEAMVLVVFVACALVVFTQVFAESAERSTASDDLTHAVTLASDAAERFAVDPTKAIGEYEAAGLQVVCEVTPEQTAAGVLYHADIRVYAAQSPEKAEAFRSAGSKEPLYTLQTSAYVSGTGGDGA